MRMELSHRNTPISVVLKRSNPAMWLIYSPGAEPPKMGFWCNFLPIHLQLLKYSPCGENVLF